jgi:NIPSNAP
MAARARAIEPSLRCRFAPHSCADEDWVMIYELRIYRCVAGRKSALLSRFENETLRIWEKHGIRQAGFWTTLIGESSQHIIYMIAWDSMADREKRWGVFLADPEWAAVVAKTERDGELVEDISSQLLTPAAFSAVK